MNLLDDLIARIKVLQTESQNAGRIPLLVILGPTASGKTALALELARHLNSEIVSADSRQLYREMDIGTAKPTPAELSQTPHHLIDIANPDQTITLSDYLRLAQKAISEIYQKKKLPILVGGTGLYISALTENYDLPEAVPDLELRHSLEQIAKTEGPARLHQILSELDPLSAQKIHPHNLRYLIRAIEIAQGTKSPKVDRKKTSPYQVLSIGIDWPRDELYERINQRIDAQIEQGLITETKSLIASYSNTLPALSSLGYQEIAQYLAGELTLSQALDLFKQHTRNYAKRQLTWFRKLKNVYWIPAHELNNLQK